MPSFTRHFRRANGDRLELSPTSEAVSPFRAVTGSEGSFPGGVLISACTRIAGQAPAASPTIGNGFNILYRGATNTDTGPINYCVDIYNTSGKGELWFTFTTESSFTPVIFKWLNLPLFKQSCRYNICLATDFGGENELLINGINYSGMDEQAGPGGDPSPGVTAALWNAIGARRSGSAIVGAFDGVIQNVLVVAGRSLDVPEIFRLRLSQGWDPLIIAQQITAATGYTKWSHTSVSSESPESVYSPSYSPQNFNVIGTVANVDRLPVLPTSGGTSTGSLGGTLGYSP